MSKILISLKPVLCIFFIIHFFLPKYDCLNAEENEMFMQKNKDNSDIRLAPFFIKNDGQLDPGVQYYEWMSNLLFTMEGIVFPLYNGKEKAPMKLFFAEPAKEIKILGENSLGRKVSYFIGNDISSWVRGVKSCRSLLYKGIYRNINIQFHAKGGQIYFEIIVKPGGDITDIKLSFDDAYILSASEKGLLNIEAQGKKYTLNKPSFYQDIKGKRVNVSGNFRILDKKTFGFSAPGYDRDVQLIIKQVLIDTAYFEKKFREIFANQTADNAGNIYITGGTSPDNFSLKQGLPNQRVHEDAVVLKFDATSGSFIYLVFIGGSLRDLCVSISADKSGSVYLIGDTSSKDFPVRNALEAEYKGGGTDVFITKINASGNDLVYSTYLGGSNHDIAADIEIDKDKNIYVTGTTKSLDFPITRSIQIERAGYYDAFVVKINRSGRTFVYSTYLGGNNWDAGFHIKADDEGNTFVTGCTKSLDFPLKNPAYAEHRGVQETFASIINHSGNDLIYSTYLVLNGYDCKSEKAMDLFRNMYFRRQIIPNP